MIKFNVLNRWSGKVQFTEEIDCDENENYSIKLGLAVKQAIKNNTNLRHADLRHADLSYADLSYTNLRSADLRYANLRSADLSFVDLLYADLLFTDLSSADLRYAKNLVVPVTFGPAGKELRTGHAVYDNSKIMVRLGCFYGTEKEAIVAINEKYGKRSSYAQMVSVACRVAKERGVLNPTQGGEDE